MAEFKVEHKKQQSSEHGTVSQRKGATVLPDNRGQVSQARALTDNHTVQLAVNSSPKPLQMKLNEAHQLKRKKVSHWNQKQKDQNKRLFERREIRQAGYEANRQREIARDHAFMQSWLPEIQRKKYELLNNEEVARAIRDKNCNKETWTDAVNELVTNLENLHSSNSNATRAELRAKMESAWTSKQVGREGEKRALSTMPPKIWYTTQEIFDAKVIFLTRRNALIPGGAGHKDVNAGKTPDFFTEDGVGDAQNVDTAKVQEAIDQSINTVTSKVAKYPDAKVTVTVGLHNCPEILNPENVAIVKRKISQLEAKPSCVYLVCGSDCKLAFP